ncbi:hypothetical protein [Desulfobacca acetoxidans]|uniref:Uncharacterized protein n=1 Tax=Desulfobacca acetoxidans (strain ATCC 700848 / DSM 11109 / ASRB2) TaxID=880072 RepID=F2NCK6_DESAR|nr:hypothetical protein [Desulfobacca acetoxidans]AEB09140.1 hypothetical protein Desac_1283 [Desulfobacca acetoxidans DSM 11109]
MISGRNDDDRERPDWRAIDRIRDRSRHRRVEPKPPGGRKQEEKIRREVLKQAEALFGGKQQRPEYKKAAAELADHRATPHFSALAAKFLAAYGLPEDWRALMLFLDYPESTVIVEAVHRLQQLAPTQTMTEIQGFKGKLRTLSLISPFPEVREQAEATLAKL